MQQVVENALKNKLSNQQNWRPGVGGGGWPTVYVVDWTLNVIEWIISELDNKDTTKKCIHSINYNV